ncbi:11059_t:CDS:2, partial [Paraglomus occultum]
DVCTHWLDQWFDEGLNEKDLADEEKDMIRLWNRYLSQLETNGDCHLSGLCIQFAKTRARDISAYNLRMAFARHLLQMAGAQVIDGNCVAHCLRLVDSIADGSGV